MSEAVQTQGEVVLKEVTRGRCDHDAEQAGPPERVDPEMEVRYFALLDECAASEEVRVIVVTGAGRGFCAGADMKDLQDLGAGEHQRAGRHENAERTPQNHPHSIPKPIVAAINGPCAGIGLVQALMCDIRFAASGVKLTTAFARRGLVAEHGISWILPRLVGPANALDLLLSGRVVLAEEAHELGLVNRVVAGESLLDETLAYARDLAVNCSPASMATMKGQVYADLDRGIDETIANADRLSTSHGARGCAAAAESDARREQHQRDHDRVDAHPLGSRAALHPAIHAQQVHRRQREQDQRPPAEPWRRDQQRDADRA